MDYLQNNHEASLRQQQDSQSDEPQFEDSPILAHSTLYLRGSESNPIEASCYDSMKRKCGLFERVARGQEGNLTEKHFVRVRDDGTIETNVIRRLSVWATHHQQELFMLQPFVGDHVCELLQLSDRPIQYGFWNSLSLPRNRPYSCQHPNIDEESLCCRFSVWVSKDGSIGEFLPRLSDLKKKMEFIEGNICSEIHLSYDPEEYNRFLDFSMWANKEAMNKYFSSSEAVQCYDLLEGLCVGSPDISIWKRVFFAPPPIKNPQKRTIASSTTPNKSRLLIKVNEP